jgi:glycine/D-amino acid oxidase-like deaminating enzyme
VEFVAALPGKPESLWLDGPTPARREPLHGDASADVVVVGAGIVGAATALMLAERGVSVILLEARTVGGAVTGHSTAKVSALHESSYSEIRRKVGREAAAAYAASNLEGVRLVAGLAAEHEIECSLESAPNYLYTEDESSVPDVEEEHAAAAEAGLGVELTDSTELPFRVLAAVRLDDQLAIDSAAFTRGLAAAAERAGARVHEGSRVRSASVRDARRLELESGATVRAERVVLATQMPLLDRGLYFARLRPQMSYAVTAPSADPPHGMYLGTGSSTRSIRSAPAVDGSRRLIVGGEGHKVGQGDAAEAYGTLAGWASDRFGIDQVTHRWSAHDLMSPDGMPLVGRLAPWAPRVLCATGFGKWGLAQGVSAAAMLCGEIVGEPDPKAEAYDSTRLNPKAQSPEIVRENANVALHFVGDRIRRRGAPRCTHLGCLLDWNEGDATWDCPCHGSRFAEDGAVLNGPASAPLDLG